ncbi:TIGR03086 family metal-binding protein [Actinomadura hibisca]|uniref:TIGR03086 family metal-binding protein n=1 Tax=Actinomadura hibisca TaxID=68565 RepID=UPI0008360794|nr:TIGR03086 family metal-binding protein [Actinomadura hibisca]
MSRPIDLGEAARALAEVVSGVKDDQLTAPTPCPDYTVADLLDHVDGLASAFTRAAAKDFADGPSTPPSVDGSRLDAEWRTRVPEKLTALAEAWRDPAAWEGMTQAGGIDLPGELAGLIALDEVVVHGWDVARATGQPYRVSDDVVEACMGLFDPAAGEMPEGAPFGPPVAVPADAAPLERLVGLSGRDPDWAAGR